MTLVGLVLFVIVCCVVYWAIMKIMAAFAVPAQIQVVVQVLIVLLAVLWLVSQIGGYGPSIRVR